MRRLESRRAGPRRNHHDDVGGGSGDRAYDVANRKDRHRDDRPGRLAQLVSIWGPSTRARKECAGQADEHAEDDRLPPSDHPLKRVHATDTYRRLHPSALHEIDRSMTVAVIAMMTMQASLVDVFQRMA